MGCEQVSRADYDTLQRGLRDLYAHQDLDTLAQVAVDLVQTLIESDLIAYNEVDPLRKRVHALFAANDLIDEERYLELAPTFERHLHQHPLVAHFHQHPADGPRKISDFLSDEQFRVLDLHREFFAKVPCHYQIAVTVPAPPPLMVAISVNRIESDFTERDRALLAMLQPHLRQAYDNALVVNELTDRLGDAEEALDRIDCGVVAIDSNRRVVRATVAATHFVHAAFPNETRVNSAGGGPLPGPLDAWAADQIDALARAGDAPPVPAPLFCETADGRIMVRLTPDQRPGGYLLVLRRLAALDDPVPLRGLGLTDREADVLLEVVNGRHNADAAKALNISPRTVHKHLENVYTKLGVNDRAAAVARALEWLRP